MNRAGRRLQIVSVIAERDMKKKGAMTMTMVAKRIGLSPSSYLMELLRAMADDGMISCVVRTDPRRDKIGVYWFGMKDQPNIRSRRNANCNAPWSCPTSKNDESCYVDGDVECLFSVMLRK